MPSSPRVNDAPVGTGGVDGSVRNAISGGGIMLTPIKSIRAKCLDCCCGSSNEVKLCPKGPSAEIPCALYEYRFGKRPVSMRREYTPEQRAGMAARLKTAHVLRERKRGTPSAA